MFRPSPEHCLEEMIDTQASERQHLGNENSSLSDTSGKRVVPKRKSPFHGSALLVT